MDQILTLFGSFPGSEGGLLNIRGKTADGATLGGMFHNLLNPDEGAKPGNEHWLFGGKGLSGGLKNDFLNRSESDELAADYIGSSDSAISGLLQGKGLPKGVQFVGPVGIGALISQAAQVGINYFLQFIAMISVYLAIFNLLPIPALDGGKLLFLAIEKIKGGAINRRVEENVTVTFFLLLIILMIWVTIKDIGRLF